ncbi:3-oxoacyl-ACP reductase FabG [Amycolatopsis lexingtonensis]|nr:3-oxoacyl-ACP reductase FabG [Amycolatopsis lexingtonensis]
MSRSVLVTGGNRGIGLAIAREMADGGDSVAVTYRSGKPPEGVFGVECDVTSKAQVEAAFREIEKEQGPVEVLISNAGITRDKLVPLMKEEDFLAVLDTNLTAAFRVSKQALRGMTRKRAGRIVFVSSVVAFTGQPGQANYGASKAGLVGLARTLAREFARWNITVNVVAPGLVETDMTAGLSDAVRADSLAKIPLARTAAPEEVAKLVRFLAGPDAGYVTGAVVPVDGGLSMGL